MNRRTPYPHISVASAARWKAVAQACYLNDIPFVIIRAISDKADGSEMEDYTEFEKKAAARSAKVVQYMVEEHF